MQNITQQYSINNQYEFQPSTAPIAIPMETYEPEAVHIEKKVEMTDQQQTLPTEIANPSVSVVPVVPQHDLNIPIMAIPVYPDQQMNPNIMPVIPQQNEMDFMSSLLANYRRFEICSSFKNFCSQTFVWDIYGVSGNNQQKTLIMQGNESRDVCLDKYTLECSSLNKHQVFKTIVYEQKGCCNRLCEVYNDRDIPAGSIGQSGCCCCSTTFTGYDSLYMQRLHGKYSCCNPSRVTILTVDSSECFINQQRQTNRNNLMPIYLSIIVPPSMVPEDMYLLFGIMHSLTAILRQQ
ncbi:hypothetical protein WA158_002267 [Blastocystis sp. Blastoise]